jgi:transcriptional antiterminator NusG
MNWYIIYVRGSYEEKLVEYLNECGFTAFVPMKAKYFRDNGVAKTVNQLLFPNYIFVESDLDNVEFSEKLELLKKRKSGFVKQLRHDLQGTSALDSSEKAMIERLIGKNNIIENSIGFIENDKVVVTQGPLMGFESHIVYINRHKRIATIEIDIMGEIRSVQVSLEIVSKI